MFWNPLWALLLTALGGVSFWGELRGYPRVLRRLLPKRISGNLVARLANDGADGKIVLAGEYAVLWGAPAVCMAVDRRAVVTVDKSANGQCRVTTPGFDGDAQDERGVRPPGEGDDSARKGNP